MHGLGTCAVPTWSAQINAQNGGTEVSSSCPCREQGEIVPPEGC